MEIAPKNSSSGLKGLIFEVAKYWNKPVSGVNSWFSKVLATAVK